MYKNAMKPDSEFKEKLDALVRSIASPGRAQAEELVASVVNAGGVSESALVEMLRDQSLSTSLRLSICWLLPRLRVEAAGDVLKSLMSDPSEQMREEAALGLGLVSEDDDVVEVLLNALEYDSSKPVRLAALHALGIRSSPHSATRVMGILQNPEEDAEVRADAAEALAHIKDERIVDVLIESLQDNSPLVRYSAAYSLGQQGDMRALPALREIASRDRATTQWGSVASRALDSIEIISNRIYRV
jgi:HEAT repeat protein